MRHLTQFSGSISSALIVLTMAGCASIPQISSAKRPGNPNPKVAQQYLAARDLETQGKFEEAREQYEQLLAKYPENPDYLHRLAVVCTRLQRYGEAKSLFERAKQRDPNNVNLLTDIGYTAFLRGDYVEAERILRDAVHAKPSDKRANSNLALALGMQGKTEESLSLLKKTGDEATALCGLAYIYSQRGEHDLAEQKYREALEHDPKCADATRALGQLAKRRKPVDESFASSDSAQQRDGFDAEDDGTTAAIVKLISFEESSTEPEENRDASEPRLIPTQQQSTGRVSLTSSFDESNDDEDQDDQSAATAPHAMTSAEIRSDDDWSDEPSSPIPAAKKTAALTEGATDRDLWETDQPAETTAEPSTLGKTAKSNSAVLPVNSDDDWE